MAESKSKGYLAWNDRCFFGNDSLHGLRQPTPPPPIEDGEANLMWFAPCEKPIIEARNQYYNALTNWESSAKQYYERLEKAEDIKDGDQATPPSDPR